MHVHKDLRSNLGFNCSIYLVFNISRSSLIKHMLVLGAELVLLTYYLVVSVFYFPV